MKKCISLALLALALTGCAIAPMSASLSRPGTGLSQVYEGTLEGSRPVYVNGAQSGTGALAGGVLGGLAGSTMGKGKGKTAMTVLGVLLGAGVGAAVEETHTRTQAEELVIRLDRGGLIAVVQPYSDVRYYAGQRVRVFTDGRHSRVTPH